MEESQGKTEECQGKVPVIVSTGIICFLVGLGLGLLGMRYYDDQPGRSAAAGNATAAPAPGGPGGPGGPGPMGGGPPGGMKGGMGGPMGKMGGGMGGKRGGGGPDSKRQLAALVIKLNQLTEKPLAVNLNAEQKKKVRDQLSGLEDSKDLAEEDAKKRLDAILEVVQGQKNVLEAAGFRWPSAGGFAPSVELPNPFTDAKNSVPLRDLRDRMAKP